MRPLILLAGIALQLVGLVSSFVLPVLIVHTYGLAEQGRFAYGRAAIDLIAAISVFGLPQFVAFLFHNGVPNPRTHLRMTLKFAIIAAAAGLAGLLAATAAGFFGAIPVVVLVIGSSAMAFHLILRGAAMAQVDAMVLGAITAGPSVVLLLAFFVLASADLLVPLYAGSYVVTSLLTGLLLLVMSRKAECEPPGPLPLRTAVTYGSTSALLAITAPLLQWHALETTIGSSAEAAGTLSLYLIVVSASLVMINIVAPYIYNAIALRLRPILIDLGFLTGLACIAGAMAVAAVAMRLDLLPVTGAGLGLCVALALASLEIQLLGTTAMARGRLRPVYVSQMVHVSVYFGCVIVLPSSAISALTALAVSRVLSAAVLAVMNAQEFSLPLSRLTGVRALWSPTIPRLARRFLRRSVRAVHALRERRD